METLKDIEEPYLDNMDDPEHLHQAVKVDKLRELAIRWVKIDKDEMNTADWIDFFNIEKEFADLVFGEEAQEK